jgi:succinate dehydrogenase / fumarate reductase, flavoprotein subunit
VSPTPLQKVSAAHDAFADAAQASQQRNDRLLAVNGDRTARDLHRELGRVLWDYVGMSRNEAGLGDAVRRIPHLREEFWSRVSVPGDPNNMNKNLEYAGRVADYLEFAELLTLDALERRESCGGHFREESQTPDNEAMRNDKQYSYVAAWEFTGVDRPPVLHQEPLTFEYVKPSQRSYK